MNDNGDITRDSKFSWGVLVVIVGGVGVYWSQLSGVQEQLSGFRTHTAKIEEKLSSIDSGVERMLNTIEELRDSAALSQGRDSLQDQKLGDMEKRIERLEAWRSEHREK